jgi:hypothetical protein
MTNPLIAHKDNKANTWHREVFATWGTTCWICRKRRASDAAHVISRTKLGKHRYDSPLLGRPLCRQCHIEQTLGKVDFDRAAKRLALRAANSVLKVPIYI